MTRTLQEKYSHVRGELKRARRRVQELEERNQFLEETLAMRERELATLRPTIVGVGDHVRRLLQEVAEDMARHGVGIIKNGERLEPREVFITKPAKE